MVHFRSLLCDIKEKAFAIRKRQGVAILREKTAFGCQRAERRTYVALARLVKRAALSKVSNRRRLMAGSKTRIAKRVCKHIRL